MTFNEVFIKLERLMWKWKGILAKKQRLSFRNRDTIQKQMVSQSDMTALQQCGSLL